MIKIQEHINRNDSDEFLDSLANCLWDFLNPKNKSESSYTNHSVVKRLSRLIAKTDEEDYSFKFANNDLDYLNRQKKFLNFLNDDDCYKLKKIIVSRPEELVELREEILEIIKPEDLYIQNGRLKQTLFGELITSEIFSYKKYRRSQICLELLTKMNLSKIFCPYCNSGRVTITKVNHNDSDEELKKAYLDIDHFFPKVQNPYFAASFYNLIPCCHNCNSNEKGSEEFSIFTHTNPFHKSYNDNQSFCIDPDYYIKNYTEDLKIKDKYNNVDNMDRDLNLTNRYRQMYLDQVNELIKNYSNYQHYRKSTEFGYDYKDVLTQKVPRSTNEILTKEAGKMYRDVFKAIDVFDLID